MSALLCLPRLNQRHSQADDYQSVVDMIPSYDPSSFVKSDESTTVFKRSYPITSYSVLASGPLKHTVVTGQGLAEQAGM